MLMNREYIHSVYDNTNVHFIVSYHLRALLNLYYNRCGKCNVGAWTEDWNNETCKDKEMAGKFRVSDRTSS